MIIKPIRTEQDHAAALARIEELFSTKPGTTEFDELDALTTLVEAYEDEHHPIEPPSPADQRYYFEDAHGQLWSVTRGDPVLRGQCSGIPSCCIDYYVNVHTKHFQPIPVEWGYVPCPQCITNNNRIEVKHCTDNDGAECICGTWKSRRKATDDAAR